MDKCGEIYRIGPKQFIFSCAYCSEKFMNHTDAFDHIENHSVLQLSNEYSDCNKQKRIFHHQCTNENQLDEQPDDDNVKFLTVKQEPELIDSDQTKQDFAFDSLTIKEEINYVESPITYNSRLSVELEVKKSRESLQPVTDKSNKQREVNSRQIWSWGPKFTAVQCDICKQSLKKAYILRHFNSQHQNSLLKIKRFPCPNCKREYKTPYALRNHMKIHLNIKNYNCDICGCQFHSEPNLKRHIRTHTGEKRHKCSYCNKSFAQSSTLVTHTRLHTGEKPFKCSICPKAFHCSSALRTHMRHHVNDRQHKCLVCDMEFGTRKTLREHYRTRHIGERAFKCEIFDKAFNKKYHYNVILPTSI